MLTASYGFQRGTSEFVAKLTFQGLTLKLTDLVVHQSFTVKPGYLDLQDLYTFYTFLANAQHPKMVEIKCQPNKRYKETILQVFEANNPLWVFVQVRKKDGGVLFVIQLRAEELSNLAVEGLKMYDIR